MLTYTSLKERPKEFLAATSLSLEEFGLLLPYFDAAYHAPLSEKTATGTPRQRRPGAGVKGRLAAIENKLLFILVYQKTYPLQTMQGLHFGLGQPQTNYWIHRLLPVLQQALQQMGHAPERDAAKVCEALGSNPLFKELLIDGTERRRQRPKDPQAQKEHYSGKKKAHTDKNLIVSERQTGKVVFLGATVAGTIHDKKQADTEQIAYAQGTILAQDTGFQGYAPAGVHIEQPKKKPRGGELSVGERFLNGVLSSLRVTIEHALSGIKRCRIVKDVLRATHEGLTDRVMEIACSLHNLRRDVRQPLPSFNLLEMAEIT